MGNDELMPFAIASEVVEEDMKTGYTELNKDSINDVASSYV